MPPAQALRAVVEDKTARPRGPVLPWRCRGAGRQSWLPGTFKTPAPAPPPAADSAAAAVQPQAVAGRSAGGYTAGAQGGS